MKIVLNYKKELSPAEAVRIFGMTKLLNSLDPGTIGKMYAADLRFDKIGIEFLEAYLQRATENLYIFK